MASPCSFPDLPDFSKEVTIIINEEQPNLIASFHVPKSLLTEKSDFFQAACRNEWKEATSRVVKLPDVEPRVFSLCLFWTYRGKLAARNEWDLGDAGRALNAPVAQSSLVKLWILADRLGDTQLHNAAMDEMVDTARFDAKCAFELFPPDLIALIWSATTPGRSLRTLVIDYHISYVYIGDIQNAIDEYHPEFVKEPLLVSLVSNKADDWHLPFSIVEEQPCHYHDHDDKFTEQACLGHG